MQATRGIQFRMRLITALSYYSKPRNELVTISRAFPGTIRTFRAAKQ